MVLQEPSTPPHSQLSSVWPHLHTKSIPTGTCSTCKPCSINPPPNLPLTNLIPHKTTFRQPLSVSHILPTTKHYPPTALQTTLQHSLHLQTILHSSKIHVQSTLQQFLTILPNNHQPSFCSDPIGPPNHTSMTKIYYKAMYKSFLNYQCNNLMMFS